jgi:hypothetical protein
LSAAAISSCYHHNWEDVALFGPTPHGHKAGEPDSLDPDSFRYRISAREI